MTDQKSTPEEFRTFIRELGIRAFDQLAARFAVASEVTAEQSDRAARRSASLARLAGYWSGMQAGEKEQFFDQMIAAAQSVAAAAPALVAMGRLRKQKRGLPDVARKELRVSRLPDGPIDVAADSTVDDREMNAYDDSPKRKKKKKKDKKKEKKNQLAVAKGSEVVGTRKRNDQDYFALSEVGIDSDKRKKKKKKKKKKS